MTFFLRTLAVLLFALLPQTMLAQTSTETAVETTTETGLVAGIEAAVSTHTEVQTGAYILRLTKVSPRDGTFDVDMWVWFRWKGADVRPDETFEIANGVITSRSEGQIEDDGGVNYATVRVQATIFHEYDVSRFPLDDHLITIQLEDSELNDTQLSYVVDEGIALDPAVSVAGWDVSLQPTAVVPHVYATNYGLRSAAEAGGTYSRMTLAVTLERTSYGTLFKSFWITALAVLLGLLAFLIKADDLDARFGMGVGSIFAASASAFVISDSLPPTTAITLAEQINLIAVGVIFTSVFISIWSLRLRYADNEEGSLKLDRIAMWSLGILYLVLNALALMFDFS
jgi:hypothetical protein